MATGPEHYREAERLLAKATAESCDSFMDDVVIAAQAHATLALAAATALSHGLDASSRFAWHQAAGEPPVSP